MSDLDLVLVVVGVLGVVVAALSSQLRRLPVSEPLLALAAGVLLGPQALAVLDLGSFATDTGTMHEPARILLAVSVMAVALRFPFPVVRSRVRPVVLLLLVAMPAMALASGLVAWGVLGLSLTGALLLGSAVSPTDPVLASSAVTGDEAERVLPARLRQVLSLESGANDGLALPLVVVAVALAGRTGTSTAALESLWQVLGAVALGATLGAVAGRALRAGEAHGSTAHGPVLLLTVVLALMVLGAGGLLGVDDVLAVFVAGLAFNRGIPDRDRWEELSVDEAVNRFAVLPIFLALGAMLPWEAWDRMGGVGLAAGAGVVLLRRVPVVLLLARPLGLRLRDAVFLGWFGPVGVSALFYLSLEAERAAVPEQVLALGSLVVVLSTVLHGVTAAPARAWYARQDSADST